VKFIIHNLFSKNYGRLGVYEQVNFISNFSQLSMDNFFAALFSKNDNTPAKF
jgi:hypothetical protein